MKNQIDRIKSKLKDRGITLNEPVPMEKIIDFENKYNIKLPKELVAFYTQIGNAGLKCIEYDEDDEKYEIELYLEELYPFEDLKFNPKFINQEFTLEYTFWEIWNENQGSNFNWDSLEYGNIELIDLGCGMTWHIILNGKHIGEMWEFTEMGITPCYPKLKFLDWFEVWLDNLDNSEEVWYKDYENPIRNLYNNLENSKMIFDLHLEKPHPYCQDWELEVADSNRIFEFINYFDNQPLNQYEVYFLIGVIIESYEDYLKVGKNQEIEFKIKKYLKENLGICKAIIEEYSCEGQPLEDCFLVTPLIRGIKLD